MGDPVSMMAAGSLGAKGAGAVLSAYGAASSGYSQAAQLNYQAGVAEFNKKIALQNEDYASAQGEEQAVDTGLKNRFVQGAVRTNLAASGVDVNAGSAKDVQTSQAEIGARDVATVRNRAARFAYGFATEAEQDDMQSALYKMGASSVNRAIPLNVASSLLSREISVSSSYLEGKSSGLFG